MSPKPKRHRSRDRWPTETFGGHLADVPLPHVRYFDDGRKRPVVAEVTTWRGISIGAKHWYAHLKEVDNPIWHPTGRYPDNSPIWRLAWDDAQGKGRTIKKDCDTEGEAWAWCKTEFERSFGSATHRFYWHRRPPRRLPRDGD